MVKVYISRTGSLGSTASDRFNSVINQRTWRNTAADATLPSGGPGVFRNLRVKATVAAGGSTSHIFSILKNSVATGITVTVTGTTIVSDQVNSFSCIAGDLLVLKRVASGGSPATSDFLISIEFVSINGTAQYYGGVSGGPSNSLTQISGALTPLSSFSTATTANSLLAGPIATPIVINTWNAYLSVAPGGANTRTLALVKNGTVQDGSGGTPDTRIAFTGSQVGPYAPTTAVFSLTCTTGDILTVQAVPTGGSGATTNVGWGISADSFTPGESNFDSNAFAGSGPNPSTVNYNDRAQQGGWNATETSVEAIAGITTFNFGKFHAYVDTTIVTGSYVLDLRINHTTTSNPPLLTFTNADLSKSDLVNSIDITESDTWDIRATPSGTPTSRPFAWSAAQFISENLPTTGELSGLYFFNAARTSDKYYSNISGLPPVTTTTEVKIPNPTAVTYLIGDE